MGANSHRKAIRAGLLKAARICELRGRNAHITLMNGPRPGSIQAVALCHEANEADRCAIHIRKVAEEYK